MGDHLVSLVHANGPANLLANRVLAVLANIVPHRTPDAPVYPGIARIAKHARCTERSVTRTLRALEADGWVKIEVGGGRNRTNRYYLNVTMLSGNPDPPVTVPRDLNPDRRGTETLTGQVLNPDRAVTRTVRTEEEQLTPTPLSLPSSREQTDMRHPKMKLPEGWTPDPTTVTYAKSLYPTVDIEQSVRQFTFHFAASGTTCEDWNARLMLWVSRDADRIAERVTHDRDLEGRTDDLGFPLVSAKAWHRHIA